MKKWWTEKAVPWLKKYWPWIILPVGVLLVLLKVFQRRPNVIAPELLGALEHERKVDEETAEKAKALESEKEKRLSEIEEAHKEVVERLTEAQKEQVKHLRDDPESLNSFLLDVGKEVRGG